MCIFKKEKWVALLKINPLYNNKMFFIMSEIKNSIPVLKKNGVKKDFRLIIRNLTY